MRTPYHYIIQFKEKLTYFPKGRKGTRRSPGKRREEADRFGIIVVEK